MKNYFGLFLFLCTLALANPQFISDYNFNFYIDDHSHLWAWGENSSGQLGLGHTNFVNYPTANYKQTWRSLSKRNSIIGIQSDSTLWIWGGYSNRFLPVPSVNESFRPIQIGSQKWLEAGTTNTYVVGITLDSSLWIEKTEHLNWPFPDTVPTINLLSQWGNQKWLHISTGEGHVLVIAADSTLWAWGDNEYGQVGNGKIGGDYSYYVKTPTQISTSKWIQIYTGPNHSFAIAQDSSLWQWGKSVACTDELILTPKLFSTQKWRQISTGISHTLAIAMDSTLWAWGCNFSGQLGNGSTQNSASPIQVSSDQWISVLAATGHIEGVNPYYGPEYRSNIFSMGVKADYSIWQWGSAPTWLVPSRMNRIVKWSDPTPAPLTIPEQTTIFSNIIADSIIVKGLPAPLPDTLGGNRIGLGRSFNLQIGLRNITYDTITPSTVILRPITSGLTILDSIGEYNSLLPQTITLNNNNPLDYYTIHLADTLSQTKLQFEVIITEKDTKIVHKAEFNIPLIQVKYLVMSDDSIHTSRGNNNHVFDAGETVELKLQFNHTDSMVVLNNTRLIPLSAGLQSTPFPLSSTYPPDPPIITSYFRYDSSNIYPQFGNLSHPSETIDQLVFTRNLNSPDPEFQILYSASQNLEWTAPNYYGTPSRQAIDLPYAQKVILKGGQSIGDTLLPQADTIISDSIQQYNAPSRGIFQIGSKIQYKDPNHTPWSRNIGVYAEIHPLDTAVQIYPWLDSYIPYYPYDLPIKNLWFGGSDYSYFYTVALKAQKPIYKELKIAMVYKSSFHYGEYKDTTTISIQDPNLTWSIPQFKPNKMPNKIGVGDTTLIAIQSTPDWKNYFLPSFLDTVRLSSLSESVEIVQGQKIGEYGVINMPDTSLSFRIKSIPNEEKIKLLIESIDGLNRHLFDTIVLNSPVLKKYPQMAFDTIPNQIYQVPALKISILDTLGLTKSMQNLTPEVCFANLDSLWMHNTGKCEILLKTQPNDRYYPSQMTQSFNILPSPQTIDFPSISTQNLNFQKIPLWAKASSQLPVLYTSLSPEQCGVIQDTIQLLSVGECQIQAEQMGNARYLAAPIQLQKFTILENPLSVIDLERKILGPVKIYNFKGQILWQGNLNKGWKWKNLNLVSTPFYLLENAQGQRFSVKIP